MRDTDQRLMALAAEAKREIENEGYDRWEEIRNDASQQGQTLLQFSYFDLSASRVDSGALHALGLKLPQLELLEQHTTGRDAVDECLGRIIELAAQYHEFCQSLNLNP